uniref:Uncharacterized protein n=1 Tax=Anopheles farauti TaxID=69004 RepID=A0A182QI77_9DIPT
MTMMMMLITMLAGYGDQRYHVWKVLRANGKALPLMPPQRMKNPYSSTLNVQFGSSSLLSFSSVQRSNTHPVRSGSGTGICQLNSNFFVILPPAGAAAWVGHVGTWLGRAGAAYDATPVQRGKLLQRRRLADGFFSLTVPEAEAEAEAELECGLQANS